MYFRKEETWVNHQMWSWIYFTDEEVEGGSFDDLLRLWISYYDCRISFIFVFDTSDLHQIPPLYLCLQMALFIRELKQRDCHYLVSSHILISHHVLLKLIEVIFAIQKPVAPVYIYLTDQPWTSSLSPSSVILP